MIEMNQKTSENNNWVCVLCHKICHYRNLGDLYGPYHIDFSQEAAATTKNTTNTNNNSNSNNNDNNSNKSNVTNSGDSASLGEQTLAKEGPPPPKKSRYSLLNHSIAASNMKKCFKKEIWIHEDCLVWSDGVHIVGNKIRAMEEVIKDSFNHKCAACKTTGATIGCVGKRCRRKYHYICAVNNHCLLDEASFTLNCDKCVVAQEKEGQLEQQQTTTIATAVTTTTTAATTTLNSTNLETSNSTPSNNFNNNLDLKKEPMTINEYSI